MSMEVRNYSFPNSKLKVKVMISDELGFCVTSTLIMGEKDCVLVDCQWTRSNAYRVIAEICETNLNLKAVFASHAHPDHYWGIGHIGEAFPNAKLYAMAEDIPVIDEQFNSKTEHWESVVGKVNLCRLKPVIEPLPESNIIELEGEEIIVYPQVWGDLKYNTVVWVPSIKTFIGSDVLFLHAHPFTCEVSQKGRYKWYKDLEKFSKFGAELVVPGHVRQGEILDARAFQYTMDYIRETERTLESTDNEKEFFYDMCMKFPDDVLVFLSNDMNSSVFLGGREWSWSDMNDDDGTPLPRWWAED
ncbi:MAG: MBL fold metallo-hydrolase [Oscillospiraceae bacterium]|nr:MBL fold metallo-hydrolase [Oscillospiraceae bacterium]